MKHKERLDVVLVERGLCDSRSKAQALIMSGEVYVNGQKSDKAGTPVEDEAVVELRGNPCPYVSRGGLKLEKALRDFGVERFLWGSDFPMWDHAEELERFTGLHFGGVCPFAMPAPVQVWLDVSLRRFAEVYPACGSANSAVRLSIPELEKLSKPMGWVDVCKGWA